jgi:RimJ/RimL family protein N-acetyltransferase
MLFGKIINLRAWSEHDIDKLQALKNDFDLQTQLMGLPKPNSKNKIVNWLKQRDRDESLIFFVISNKSDDTIGYIQLSNIDKLNRHAYLGICLSKDYWGKGFSQEALQLLQDYASTVLGLRKILLTVNKDNLRAISFYKKIHFRTVGLLEDHQLINNKLVDVILMEKLV